MQLKVIKADRVAEQYLHTKVVGTISSALAVIGQPDIFLAEELAEVVTYYLYHGRSEHTIASSDIFSIIKAVLAATKYEEAAIALSDHHFERRLKRSRIEVISVDIKEMADAELLSDTGNMGNRSRWDKARIVSDLVTEHSLSRQAARTVSTMVEEKIFSMGITLVPASLIKQLVYRDAAAVLHAQQELQTA